MRRLHLLDQVPPWLGPAGVCIQSPRLSVLALAGRCEWNTSDSTKTQTTRHVSFLLSELVALGQRSCLAPLGAFRPGSHVV